MADQLGLTQPTPLSLITLLVNLLLGAVISFALSWHYRRFAQTYTNRVELAHVFPIVTLVTVLIISVIKSSLALSLGLVGALSIVRFRTPIKEPEELAYLFMAIALGLGFGADQRTPTLLAAAVIMGVIAGRSLMTRNNENHNLYLNVEVVRSDEETSGFRKINAALCKHVSMVDMRRLDVRDGSLQATYYIDCSGSESLAELTDHLMKEFPGCSISFIEQKGIPAS